MGPSDAGRVTGDAEDGLEAGGEAAFAVEAGAGGAAWGGLSVVPDTTPACDCAVEEVSGANPDPSSTEVPPHATSKPATAADTRYLLILELCWIIETSPLSKKVVRWTQLLFVPKKNSIFPYQFCDHGSKKSICRSLSTCVEGVRSMLLWQSCVLRPWPESEVPIEHPALAIFLADRYTKVD